MMNCPRCDTEVDEHEAGRETDACVAKVVMGELALLAPSPIYVGRFHWVRKGEWYLADGPKAVPYYSIDIAAAWEVVGRVNKGGHIVEIVNDMVAWSVTFIHVDEPEKKYTSDWRASLPVQICRAALKSV